MGLQVAPPRPGRGVLLRRPANRAGSKAMASPLLGYNTNVRHKGKLYHIQTEDSGVNHPHIITHLFADGGRIIASKKTSYAEYVGTENYRDAVKKLMQEQHKAMFIALRDGVYDEDDPPTAQSAPAQASPAPAPAPTAGSEPEPLPPEGVPRPVDVDELERAAQRLSGSSAAAHVPLTSSAPPAASGRPEARPSGRYSSTQVAEERLSRERRASPESESIFGGDLLSEKSLDEVILSYLAEDLEETED